MRSISVAIVSMGSAVIAAAAWPSPVHARAQPPAAENGNMEEVWAAVRRGDAQMESAAYDQAIEAYEFAVVGLTGVPEWSSQLNMLRRLLAQAHLGQFRINRDPANILRARDLLAAHRSALPGEADSDRADVDNQLREIDEQIATLDQRNAASQADQSAQLVVRTPAVRPHRGHRPLLASGIILAGAGLAMVVPVVVGVVRYNGQRALANRIVHTTPPDEFDARSDDLAQTAEIGQGMLNMSVAFGVVAAVVVTSGATLTMVAVSRARSSRARRQTAAAWPQVGGAGVVYGLRF